MNYSTINELICKVHDNGKLSNSDTRYITDEIPKQIAPLLQTASLKEYMHPAGIKILGAPSSSFVQAYSLLLAKKAYKTKLLIRNTIYENLEQKLSIGIFRSCFDGANTKGFYCCKRCTLAVYPLLEMGLLHYFPDNCYSDIHDTIASRTGRFSKGVNDKIVAFTFGFKTKIAG